MFGRKNDIIILKIKNYLKIIKLKIILYGRVAEWLKAAPC